MVSPRTQQRTLVDLQRRLLRTRAAHVRASRGRQQEGRSLERSLGISLGFASVLVMILAILMDVLSFFDVQIVVSWLLYLSGALLAFRINKIRKARAHIAQAIKQRERELVVVSQRVRQLATSLGKQAPVVERVGVASYQFTSYLARYFTQALLVQLFELIPIINWLPTFMAKHYRDIVNQRRELQEAKKMLIPYHAILDRIQSLEQLELQWLAEQFSRVVRELGVTPPVSRRIPLDSRPVPMAPPATAYGFAT